MKTEEYRIPLIEWVVQRNVCEKCGYVFCVIEMELDDNRNYKSVTVVNYCPNCGKK